jgi:hypothetical protein
MKDIKITSPRYEIIDTMTNCFFEIDGQSYHLPVFGGLKPIHLRAGFVPIYKKWYGETEGIDPDLLVENPFEMNNMTDHPKLVRLGLIHFLDNMKERDKDGPIQDKLDLTELVKFGSDYYEPDYVPLPDWKEIIKKIWRVRVEA